MKKISTMVMASLFFVGLSNYANSQVNTEKPLEQLSKFLPIKQIGSNDSKPLQSIDSEKSLTIPILKAIKVSYFDEDELAFGMPDSTSYKFGSTITALTETLLTTSSSFTENLYKDFLGNFINDYEFYDLSFEEMIFYEWDNENGVYIPRHKNETTLNEAGYPILTKAYFYDEDEGYELYNRITFTRDSNNKITSILIESWDDIVFVNYNNIEFQYNSNGDYLKILEYDWDDDESEWVKKYETTYQYNGENQLIRKIWKTLNIDGNFVNDRRTSYNYTNGKLTEATTQYWIEVNVGEFDWYGGYQYTYSYVNDKLDLVVLKVFNFSTESLVNSERYKFIHDENGKVEGFTYETWDDGWEYEEKTEYVFEGDNLKEYIVKEWDDTAGELAYSHKKVYSYDSNQNLILETEYIFDGLIWTNSNYTKQTEYFWQMEEIDVTDIAEEMNISFVAYPNPANQEIRVRMSNNEPIRAITLVDALGRVVLQISDLKATDILIPTENFQEGVYYLQIIGESMSGTKPVMIKH